MDSLSISLAIDYENMMNNFWGVPLATLGDVRAIATIDRVSIGAWISSSEYEKFRSVTSAWKSPISNWHPSRPKNQALWLRQFLGSFEMRQHYDFFFEQHFPAAKLKNATTILRIHDPFGTSKKALETLKSSGNVKHGISNAIRGMAFSRALSSASSILVANSHFTANEFYRIYDIPCERIKVVPNAFEWRPPHQVYEFKRDEFLESPYFLMISGLRGSKRPDVVINSWSQLSNRLPRLVVVGDIPVSCLSLKSRKELERGRLELIPHATEQQLLFLKVNALTHIFCSTYEGFGRPVIEALLVGKRPIVNDLPVFREIAGNKANFFDIHDLASFENQLLANVHPSLDMESQDLIYEMRKYSEHEVGKKWREVLLPS